MRDMELKILKNRKNELEFEIIGEKTILNPLKYKLLDDKSVTLADWRIDHPLLTKVEIKIKRFN